MLVWDCTFVLTFILFHPLPPVDCSGNSYFYYFFGGVTTKLQINSGNKNEEHKQRNEIKCFSLTFLSQHMELVLMQFLLSVSWLQTLNMMLFFKLTLLVAPRLFLSSYSLTLSFFSPATAAPPPTTKLKSFFLLITLSLTKNNRI